MAWRLFVLGVFLTPFVLLRPVPTLGINIADLLLLLGGTLVLISREPNAQGARSRLPLDGAIVLPTSLIVLGVLISSLASEIPSKAEALTQVPQYIFGLVFLGLVLARRGPKGTVQALRAFMWGTVASLGLGLTIAVLLPTVDVHLREMGLLAMEGGRPGLFVGVGAVGKLGLLALPILYWLYQQREVRTVPAALALGVILGAVVFTRSGSGAIVAVAVLVTVAGGHSLAVATKGGRTGIATGRSLIPVTVAVVVVCGLAAMYLSEASNQSISQFNERVVDPFTESGIGAVGSAQYRFDLNKIAIEVLNEHALLGVGPGYFVNRLNLADPHVAPIVLWLDGGLLAFAGYMLLILSMLRLLFNARRFSPYLVVTGSAMLMAILGTHLSQPYIYARWSVVPLVLMLVLLLEATHVDSRPAISSPPIRSRGGSSCRAGAVDIHHRGSRTEQSTSTSLPRPFDREPN